MDRGYVTLGGEDEAVSYIIDNIELWRNNPDVISWLKSFNKSN